MTGQTQAPAGWYADPQPPGSQRWWNGRQWTEDRRPAPFTAPVAPATYQAPAYPAYGTYSAAYPAVAEVRRDIPTGTVWIWLVVLLPLVSLLPLLFFDWSGYVESSIRRSFDSPSTAWTSSFTASSWLPTLFAYPVIAAQALFAWLDWRTLKARGVDRPFHWVWIFFAVVVSNGVYVIGRGVVLRRRTGQGLGPVWAWIAVTVIGLAVSIGVAIHLISLVIPLLSTVAPGSPL